MASPPFLNLRREDYPEVKDKWLDRFITQLTDFGKRTQLSYINGIDFTNNLDAFWKTVTVQIKSTDRRIEIIPSSYGFKQIGRDIAFSTGYGVDTTSSMPPYVNRLGYQVFLGGTFSQINAATGVVKAFKIPEEYRPRYDLRVAKTYIDGNQIRNGVLWIRSNGDVEIATTPGGGTIVAAGSVIPLGETWTLETLASPVQKGQRDDIAGFPFKFSNALRENRYPSAVFVAQSWDVSSRDRQKIPAVLGGVSYDLQGSDIFIYGIAGARLGRTYEMRLLVIGA